MRARQKVSRAGVELIKSFEGLRQTAARLPDGRWTIGYGHTFSAREGARVTQEDADALLRFDLLPIVDSLNNMILVPLNQNQFDALVSFSFNIGIENFGSSSVLKRINEGRMTEAALAMDAWRSAEFNGQTYVLAPLIRRRAAEKNLFLTPEEMIGNAPSLLVRPLADVETDAALTRPSEVDAPDRGGVLSAYPAGEPQFAPQPAPQAFAPQPVVQPAAPQPVVSEPVTFAAPPPVVEEQPAPRPAATLSPYSASTYATETPVPAMPLSPYADTYVAPAVVQPAAPQPAPERQFIDLTAVTPRQVPEAPQPAAPVVPQAIVTPQEALQAAPQPVLQPSDISPYPPLISPYASPYAQPVTPQPVTLQPAAPQAPTAFQPSPQVLQPVAEPPVVEILPGGYAAPSQIREAPVQEPPAPTSFDPAFGSPIMSPEVAAALARAQDEQRQREEAERLAQQGAARAAEEARIRELQRVEAERLEQQRQEQDRIERARFEAERQERDRVEQARLEQERVERVRAEQARLQAEQQARLEAERQERERAEQARLEAERLEHERAEQARLEQERLEQARLEQERLEQARLEQARLEQERLERERAEQARLDAERVERERQAAAAIPAADDEAEKARKAEAAAALMRLYSPYGGGPLGRPLGLGAAPITQANLTPTPSADTATGPKPEAPQAAEPEPEAAKRPVEEAAAQSIVAEPATPQADESEALVFSTQVHTRNDDDDDVSSFRPFTPIMSAANMPAPIITAMNPYASPLPQAAVREATESVVEVLRPQAVAEPIARESAAFEPGAFESAAGETGLHWRERLQRPLPTDPQPVVAPEVQATPLAAAAYAGGYDDSPEGGEAWMHDGRIAMSAAEMEEHSVSWWRMFVSTIWWILLSIVGIISLGVAAGAYYKSKDLSVIRNGLQQDLAAVSIITAVIGFVLVSTSMWLMMRRLGGLNKDS